MGESASLKWALDAVNRQQIDADAKLLADLKSVWSKSGEIVDKKILKLVGHRDTSSLDLFLAFHPARKLVLGLEGVGRSFEILKMSRETLIEIVGRFHGQVIHGDAHDIAMTSVLQQATKEVYTYSVAVTSLVQSYRHLISGVPDIIEKYTKLKTEVFGEDGIIPFFSALRNANNHDGILVAHPQYTITFGEKKEITSGVAFDETKIIGNKEWN